MALRSASSPRTPQIADSLLQDALEIAPTDERIRHLGRYSVNKEGAVEFDWSLSGVELRVRGADVVGIRLEGAGAYFNIYASKNFYGIHECQHRAAISEYSVIWTNDEPQESSPVQSEVTISLRKRTEPEIKTALSNSEVCRFKGFCVWPPDAEILPAHAACPRKLEIIGDSDLTAFGNEHPRTSSSWANAVYISSRHTNACNGFAALTADMLDAEVHLMAWSGWGTHSNAALDWSRTTLPQVWQRTVGQQEGTSSVSPEQVPDAVVLSCWANDFEWPRSEEADVIESLAAFLDDVVSQRPGSKVFCLSFDDKTISCCDSKEQAQASAVRNRRVATAALELFAASHPDDAGRVELVDVDVPEGLTDPEDFGLLKHYSVRGHVKVARELAKQLSARLGWDVRHAPSTTPAISEVGVLTGCSSRRRWSICPRFD